MRKEENMLSEKASKYYSPKYDYNCAESLLNSANEEYELNLSKETFKTMGPFGGGMGVGGVCGALTGALASIGVMIIKEKAHESEKTKELAAEYYNRFVERLGTDNCLKLKDMYRQEEIKCQYVVKAAAEILEEMFAK
jgi:C_GCAxxG_C_C family probable redox protein